MKNKKRNLLIALAVITILAVIGITTFAETDKRPKIILDAGHGGFDGGAVAFDGTLEKDINLDITLKTARFLRLGGYNVILTRSDDTATDDLPDSVIAKRKKSDLKNRIALMEKHPDAMYVSIHMNKFTSTAAKGAQVFYSPNFEAAKQLGQSVQDSVTSLLQPENERVIKKGEKSTYILRNAKVPAVIVECGFLSNRDELSKLKNDEYCSKMAYAVFVGINEYITKEK